MGLQMKMWLLVVLMFGILYGVITGVGSYMGVGSASTYIILAVLFMGFQYLIGPSLVSKMMRVKWVSEKEEPELHRQVAELAQRAGIPKPKSAIYGLSNDMISSNSLYVPLKLVLFRLFSSLNLSINKPRSNHVLICSLYRISIN